LNQEILPQAWNNQSGLKRVYKLECCSLSTRWFPYWFNRFRTFLQG